MSSNLPYKQVKNVERRSWDKQAYLDRAAARSKGGSTEQDLAWKKSKRPLSSVAAALTDDYDKEEFTPAETGAAGPLNSKRAFLKARRDKVDLDSKLNTVEIINPESLKSSTPVSEVSNKNVVTASANGIGWHCTVCDCWLRDSITYVDHINGKKHQRYLGFSMRTAKSSNEQVKNKLAELAKLKQRSQSDSLVTKDDLNRKNIDEAFEDDPSPQEKTFTTRQLKTEENTDEDDGSSEEEPINQDIAAIMGFKGFK